MTSQGRSRQSKPSAVGTSPIQAQPEDTSANHTITSDEIRLRAYEIYLERGSLRGSELDDWLQAEYELDGRAQQKCESSDGEEH